MRRSHREGSASVTPSTISQLCYAKIHLYHQTGQRRTPAPWERAARCRKSGPSTGLLEHLAAPLGEDLRHLSQQVVAVGSVEGVDVRSVPAGRAVLRGGGLGEAFDRTHVRLEMRVEEKGHRQ